MTRRNRTIEVFSLSALDLFASAMGIFVLLAVMMIPYFLKGKDYEDEIGQLEEAAAESAAAAGAAEAAVRELQDRAAQIEETPDIDLTAEQQAVVEEEKRRKAQTGKIKELKNTIEAQKKALAKAASTKKKKANKVTFRFLGLKTDADSYLVLVDGANRIRERAPNLPEIVKEIVSVFGPGKKYALGFYNYSDGRLNYARWPERDFAEGNPGNLRDALAFMAVQHRTMRGGSATVQALEAALKDSAESIILVSDGVIFPKHNRGLRWRAVVENVTQANKAGVEINAVAIGIFYRNPDFWSFLNDLRRRNGGDLKAIPP